MATTKTLYFEGAGSAYADSAKNTDVGNCRIRTAFHAKRGKRVYLELSGIRPHIPSKLRGQERKNWRKQYPWKYTGFVDFAFTITDEKPNNDCNVHKLKTPKVFEWSKAGILQIVKSLGGDFDDILVIPDEAGYSAHGDNGSYNFGDEFEYDAELTARRTAAITAMQEQNEKRFGMKYDNTSYFVRNGELVMRLNVSDEALLANGLAAREYIMEV